MKERECSAEHHESNCPCQRCQKNSCGNCKKTNRDHFTAKYIAKEWHRVHKDSWGTSQTNNQKNIQYLSYSCHNDKDKTTPVRRELLRRTHNGEFFSLEDYKKLIPRKFSD